jgi:hypothetical protein
MRKDKAEGKQKVANVWCEDEEVILYLIYDGVIVPSVCEGGDDIIEDESKKWMREGIMIDDG